MEGRGEIDLSIGIERPDPAVPGAAEGPAASDSSAEIVIRVRDSGPGIPPKIRERLFFPFFTSKPGGSGMGLAVARKIVESHHGILDVDSGTGRGATFIVKLPLRGSPEPIPGKGAGR